MKTFCLKNSDENVVNAKGEQTVRAIMRSTGFIFFIQSLSLFQLPSTSLRTSFPLSNHKKGETI